MSVINRDFGKPPSLKDSLVRGKVFTDEAMELDIHAVLRNAKYARKIGQSAADLSGVSLQLEGDGNAKQLISAAYDAVYDVISPTLAEHGADTAKELFTTETSHRTLIDLSRTVDSYQFSLLTHQYRTRGAHFQVTDNGLEPQDTFAVTKRMEARRGGCPYANEGGSPYFTKFTDHIVDTYVEAHNQNMPHGWLQAVNRSLLKR